MAHRSSARAARRANRSSSLIAARRALASRSFIEGAHQFVPTAHAELEALQDIPDLLHPEARLAVDAPMLCGALDFAFAGGGCLDTLEEALDDVPLAETDWDDAHFGEDLFVADFVDICMPVSIGGWSAPLNRGFITRVLGAPPADEETFTFRRDILQELVDDEALRERFEAFYRKVWLLRLQFALQDTTIKFEETRHRVETLTLIRDVIQAACDEFGEATSGLRRIHDYGVEARDSAGFKDLEELLVYESNLASADVQVVLGADGRVRKFNLLATRENHRNRFHVSPMRRFLSRVTLFLRGYRFSSDELVERWLDHVFDGIRHFLPGFLQLLGHMEVYLGLLAFRHRCAEHDLEVCFPELVTESGRRVRGLFNPILFAQKITPVPCDLDSDTFDTIHILSGPNSGGKTRLLQAIGLAQLLGQGGFFVPAAEARLRRASGLFVSLVGLSDPRPEVGEGRLGTELIRIRQMFETSRPEALVMLDEFCSGTNPSEGEEIFYLVLTLLAELGVEAFISTHFLEFTRRLSGEDEELALAFLQVEIDEHQRPTYTVAPGVATTSLAAQTAARLGVTREELLTLVRRNKG